MSSVDELFDKPESKTQVQAQLLRVSPKSKGNSDFGLSLKYHGPPPPLPPPTFKHEKEASKKVTENIEPELG